MAAVSSVTMSVTWRLHFFFAQAFQAAQPGVILIGFAVLVRKMGKFHGLDDAVDDHRGAEAGAVPRKSIRPPS